MSNLINNTITLFFNVFIIFFIPSTLFLSLNHFCFLHFLFYNFFFIFKNIVFIDWFYFIFLTKILRLNKNIILLTIFSTIIYNYFGFLLIFIFSQLFLFFSVFLLLLAVLFALFSHLYSFCLKYFFNIVLILNMCLYHFS